MAEDEEEFAAPAGAFITAGSKKAVVPSAAALAKAGAVLEGAPAAPYDPFADDAAAPAAPATGALFQTAGTGRVPAALARGGRRGASPAPRKKTTFDPFADDAPPPQPKKATTFDPFAGDAPAKTPHARRKAPLRTPATASTRGLPTPRSAYDPFAGGLASPAPTSKPRKKKFVAPRPTPRAAADAARTNEPLLRPRVFLEDASTLETPLGPADASRIQCWARTHRRRDAHGRDAGPDWAGVLDMFEGQGVTLEDVKACCDVADFDAPPARPPPRGPPRPAPRPSSLDTALLDFDLEAATRPRPGRVPAPARAATPSPRPDAAAAAAAAKIARLEAEVARLKAASPPPAPAGPPPPAYEGRRPGYVFTTRSGATGYHADAAARAPPPTPPPAPETAPAPTETYPDSAPMEKPAAAPMETYPESARMEEAARLPPLPPPVLPFPPPADPRPKPPKVPFDLATQNVPELARICERVGGKPVDEALLAKELERQAQLWARDDLPDQHAIPEWTRPCSAKPAAGLIERIRKDPGGVVAPVLNVRTKEVRSTPLGPRVRLELSDGGQDAMAAHCKGDLTEKLRGCRPGALVRLVQWLVNEVNGAKVLIVLQFDYVLPDAADPSLFVSVPPPERTNPPGEQVKARVEANRAAALAIRDAKRKRQEAPPTAEAPLGLFRSSAEARIVDAALGAALGDGQVSHVYGPAGSGKSWLCATLAARALQRRPKDKVMYLCDSLAGAGAAAGRTCNIAVTLGVDRENAAGRCVVAGFLNPEQMALALDNDAQWLARRSGVSLVVVDAPHAVCKELTRQNRMAALKRILAAARELARCRDVSVVLVNEVRADLESPRPGAYLPACDHCYTFCQRTFRVGKHTGGRRSVALMAASVDRHAMSAAEDEVSVAMMAITATGVADAGAPDDPSDGDGSDRGFGDDDSDAMRDDD